MDDRKFFLVIPIDHNIYEDGVPNSVVPMVMLAKDEQEAGQAITNGGYGTAVAVIELETVMSAVNEEASQ